MKIPKGESGLGRVKGAGGVRGRGHARASEAGFVLFTLGADRKQRRGKATEKRNGAVGGGRRQCS